MGENRQESDIHPATEFPTVHPGDTPGLGFLDAASARGAGADEARRHGVRGELAMREDGKPYAVGNGTFGPVGEWADWNCRTDDRFESGRRVVWYPHLA